MLFERSTLVIGIYILAEVYNEMHNLIQMTCCSIVDIYTNHNRIQTNINDSYTEGICVDMCSARTQYNN